MPDESLCPPVLPPTPSHLIRYALIGAGDESGIYRNLMALPRVPTPDDPLFPILVICQSQSEAEKYMKIDPYLSSLRDLPMAMALDRLRAIHWKRTAYTILRGNKKFYVAWECSVPRLMRAMWSHWADAYSHLEPAGSRSFCKASSILQCIEILVLQIGLRQTRRVGAPAPLQEAEDLSEFLEDLHLDEVTADNGAEAYVDTGATDSSHGVFTAAASAVRQSVVATSTPVARPPRAVSFAQTPPRHTAALGSAYVPAADLTPRRTASQQPRTTATAAPASTTPRRTPSQQASRARTASPTPTSPQHATPQQPPAITTPRRRPAAHGTPSRTRSVQEPVEVPDSPPDTVTAAAPSAARQPAEPASSTIEPRESQRVHSLGPEADAFFDRGCFSNTYVEFVYRARKEAKSGADFLEKVLERTDLQGVDAVWLWNTMVYPAEPRFRKRRVVVEVSSE